MPKKVTENICLLVTGAYCSKEVTWELSIGQCRQLVSPVLDLRHQLFLAFHDLHP